MRIKYKEPKIPINDDTFVLFDVGANNGEDSIPHIRSNKNYICFAFEPRPDSYESIKNQIKDINNRYFVYNYAVSDFDGKADFYLSHNGVSSSLLEHHQNVEQTWVEQWNNLEYINTIKTKVVRLDTFLERICHFNIKKINLFRCDAQGNDLNILIGLGKYLQIIESGVIEAAMHKDSAAYKNANTKQQSIDFLKNSFIINTVVVYGDLECDIHFSKR